MEEVGFIEGRNVPEKPKEKERPVHKEQELQVYKLGDIKCVKCDEDFDKSYFCKDMEVVMLGSPSVVVGSENY